MILLSMTLETKLQQNSRLFHRVVPFDEKKDKLLQMNFTASNAELSDALLINNERLAEYINNQLDTSNVLYGIGGYTEHRSIYTRSSVFDAVNKNAEPRRLHLGIDIWGKPGTPVFAPLGGVIHSYAFNDQVGDYGATIILLHQLNGTAFYTLYGHLSLRNLANLETGKYICIGEPIGNFGEPYENGNWPPHLHFQIIKDIEGKWGDYPGVCAVSEQRYYLNNCPNPDLILDMIQYAE